MTEFDGEKIYPVRRDLLSKDVIQTAGTVHFQLSIANLNGDLPNAGDAKKSLVVWIANYSCCQGTETRIRFDEPKERVGIEQKLHHINSLNSGSGASKSFAMTNSPFPLPERIVVFDPF